jgi:hypothetical protein
MSALKAFCTWKGVKKQARCFQGWFIKDKLSYKVRDYTSYKYKAKFTLSLTRVTHVKVYESSDIHDARNIERD